MKRRKPYFDDEHRELEPEEVAMAKMLLRKIGKGDDWDRLTKGEFAWAQEISMRIRLTSGPVKKAG